MRLFGKGLKIVTGKRSRKAEIVSNGFRLHPLNFFVRIPAVNGHDLIGMIARDRQFYGMEVRGNGLFLDKPEGQGDPVDDRFGPGRTAWDVVIDRYDFFDGTENAVRIVPNAAAAGARTDGKNQFGIGHGVIGALKRRRSHYARGALAQHHIGMAR